MVPLLLLFWIFLKMALQGKRAAKPSCRRLPPTPNSQLLLNWGEIIEGTLAFCLFVCFFL